MRLLGRLSEATLSRANSARLLFSLAASGSGKEQHRLHQPRASLAPEWAGVREDVREDELCSDHPDTPFARP